MLGARLWSSVTRLVNPQFLKLVTERQIRTAPTALFIKFSPCLFAEPLKKKRRLDPAILRAREERKKKKLEKQIRRLEKNARQLKTIEEIEVPWILVDEKSIRERPLPQLTPEQKEERTLLFKEWTRYKYKQHTQDLQQIDKLIYSQQKALEELRFESEELYNEAIQIDPSFLPVQIQGPVRTPAQENYDSPDGDYTDISKKWD